jgi:uncharacterized protein YbbC (DUF1343 family)
MTFQFGLERLLTDSDRLATLKSARVGLVAHPASVTQDLTHALDALGRRRHLPQMRFWTAAWRARRQAR